MYDAGSAVFTLTGRVVREPFDRYGKLVETARTQKEHVIALGAQTVTSGFDKFMQAVTGVKDASRQMAVSVRDSWGIVSDSTTKMAVATDRDLKVVRDSTDLTIRSTTRMADEYKVAADEVVRSNERIIESNRAASDSAGGGGRGRGGSGAPGGSGGPLGSGSEQQAKKTTAAWKEGANTLANLGKWTTIATAGVGILTIKWAADFNRQMELVHTQAGYSRKDVEDLTKAVLNLAPTVGIGPTKLAEGLFHIASSGIPAAKAMDILATAAKGSQIGHAQLETTTNALVAIWKVAPKDIGNISEAMAVMNDIVGRGNLRMEDLNKAMTTGVLPAAKGVGLGLRDVGAALDVLTSRGVPAEQAATRLRTTFTLIADPTAKAQKAMAELGLSQTQLAEDMRRRGLVTALEDLQTHLNQTFPPGRKLSVDQERQALMDYGKQLEATGVSGSALEKDLEKFKNQLDTTGSSAVAQSQLITQAFGGARMGTTMMTLMQNIDDLRGHFNQLTKDNVAGQFQADWKDTQKQFSVQVAEMWAGIQKLGIQLGEWLIPKVKDLVNALITAAHWLGRHKVLAEGLAIAFGTLLTAAVVAFFGRLLLRTADGLKAIGQLGKAIGYDLPRQAGGGFRWILEQLHLVQKAADDAAASVEGVGAAGEGVGGTAGALEGAAGAGPLLGLITGIMGPEAPGSRANPLAVVVMASQMFGLGASGAAAEAETASMVASREEQAAARVGGMTSGGVLLPPNVRSVGGPATTATEAAPALAEGEMLAAGGGGIAGAVKGLGGKLMGGLGIAGGGLIAAQLAGSLIPGRAGSIVGTVGSTAAIGAGVGSIVPGIGTALGAGLGAAAGLALSIFGGHTDYGKSIADTMTKGFGGAAADNLKSQVATAIDNAHKQLQSTKTVTGARGTKITVPITLDPSQLTGDKLIKYHNEMMTAGQTIAKQLEAGWTQYKFQSEPIMFQQLRAETKKLPPEARAYAIESAVTFAKGLEDQGKLAKGSAQKLLDQAKSVFPDFKNYLQFSGIASVQAFAKALDFTHTEDKLKTTLDKMRGDFPQVTQAMDTTSGDINTKAVAVVRALESIVKGPGSTSDMVKMAKADLATLRSNSNTEFSAMESTVAQTMSDMSKSLQAGSSSAVDAANKNFNKLATYMETAFHSGFTTATQFSTQLAQVLNATLNAFGAKPLPKSTINAMEWAQSAIPNPPQLSGANTPRGHAVGGKLPGSEFGLGDVMTLVDPTGKPRARMAGDEAIFNRHQMPFVEAGLQMLGFKGAHDLWSSVNTPHNVGYARGGKLPGFASGGYVYPLLASAIIGRTDQGVDVDMRPGDPIGPIGNAKVMGTIPNWYMGQPFIWWQLLNGPRAGRYAYVAEQITNLAKPGSILAPNQAVATYASHGTGIEYGWATSSGQTLAHATTGYKEGQATPAGTDMKNFLTGLSHGKVTIGGGGAYGLGAGVVWKNIKSPHVHGGGAVGHVVQAEVNRATAAANRYGQKVTNSTSASTLSALGWTGGGSAAANEALGHKMMLAAGYPESDWPYLQRLWMKESSWDANAVNKSSGAYGIPQALGHGHPYNLGDAPAQIAWGLNYIGGRYRPGDAIQNAWRHEMANNWYGRGGRLPGYASGGWLTASVPRFAGGGTPWAPLPSGVGHIPGYRPVRVRRGASGLHTVGGGTRRGRTGSTRSGSAGSRRGGRAGGGKTKLLPISQTVANTLTSLGLGDLANVDNEIGNLDTLYTNQENLFSSFDTGATGMPQSDLNTLMGIREQEWDILYPLWKNLPGILAGLNNQVSTLTGSAPHPGHAGHPGHWSSSGKHKDQHWTPGVKGSKDIPGSGVAGLNAQIASVEGDISTLQRDLTLDTRKASTIRHLVSVEAMTLADTYGQEIATLVDNQRAIHDYQYKLTQQSINLHQALSDLSSGKPVPPSLSSIVSGIMSGSPPSTSSASNPARKALRDKIAALQRQRASLSNAAYQVSAQIKDVNAQKSADLRRLREHGSDRAWIITVAKWGIQDRITKLKASLKNLKAKLKEEDAKLKALQGAAQTITNWQTGGLQGSSSVGASLEGVAQDIISLYQQGANLPTPGRSSPTLDVIESFLKSMGLVIPAGLASGSAAAGTQAAAAYADFAAFQADRSSLFAQFGGNFLPAGSTPGNSPAAVGAGAQYYGAAAGSSAGPGALGGAPGLAGGGWLGPPFHVGHPPGPGNTTITIHQNFAAGPPDAHTWSAGVVHELGAMT